MAGVGSTNETILGWGFCGNIEADNMRENPQTSSFFKTPPLPSQLDPTAVGGCEPDWYVASRGDGLSRALGFTFVDKFIMASLDSLFLLRTILLTYYRSAFQPWSLCSFILCARSQSSMQRTTLFPYRRSAWVAVCSFLILTRI
jgi:hypothetical protein